MSSLASALRALRQAHRLLAAAPTQPLTEPVPYTGPKFGFENAEGQLDFSDLTRFNTVLSSLETLVAVGDEGAAQAALARMADQLKDMRYSAVGSVSTWLQANWPFLKDRETLSKLSAELGTAARMAYARATKGMEYHPDVSTLQVLKNLVLFMKDYSAELNKYLSQAMPKRFQHQGIRIWNPDRLPDRVVKRLMDGIDYVVALFKKRGVLPLLGEVLEQVTIRHLKPNEDVVAGWYQWSAKGGTITLMAEAATDPGRKMLTDWVHEVFLHEVGHLVHLKLLDREAREAWDAGWSAVNQAKKIQKDQLERVREVRAPERKKFWKLLLETKADLKVIKRKLQPLEAMKFHAWLKEPQLGNALVAPTKWQWTKEGKDFHAFIAAPETFLKEQRGYTMYAPDELADEVKDRFKRLERKMGVDDVDSAWPLLKPEEVKEYAMDDSAIRQALADLGTPTEYAKTNEKEDFAESFVAYMDAPEALSDNTRFRMRQALHLSGLYHKPIMKTVASVLRAAAEACG